MQKGEEKLGQRRQVYSRLGRLDLVHLLLEVVPCWRGGGGSRRHLLAVKTGRRHEHGGAIRNWWKP